MNFAQRNKISAVECMTELTVASFLSTEMHCFDIDSSHVKWESEIDLFV